MDLAHGDDDEVRPVRSRAGHTQPEGEVVVFLQDDELEDLLPEVGHPLSETVVLQGCDEADDGENAEETWRFAVTGCQSLNILLLPAYSIQPVIMLFYTCMFEVWFYSQ